MKKYYKKLLEQSDSFFAKINKYVFYNKTVSNTNDITCQRAVSKGKNGIKRRTKGVIRLTVILFFNIIDKGMVNTWGIGFTEMYGLLGF